jgi:hypothetical protein
MSAALRGPDVRIPPRDWFLVAAVAITGMIAGTLADGSLYLATPLALLLVYRGAVRHAQALEASDLYAHPDLPNRARRAVEEAAERLPLGEARVLLARVVTQAVLLFQAHETSVGASADDHGMLDDVTELVESACTSAEQLALLQAATGAADAESRAARDRFSSSLSSAAAVIRNLHLAVVGGGTVASDRVTEITADLRDEADARSRAMAELASLLEQRRRL